MIRQLVITAWCAGCEGAADAAPSATDATAVGPQPPRVRVSAGWLIGAIQDGVMSFKGVPYAAPPVGTLRWVLPQPRLARIGDPVCV